MRKQWKSLTQLLKLGIQGWSDDISGRLNDDATAYVRKDGHYVVRNDRTGDIVQISDTSDPDWIKPF